jgi:Cdc6-like AAA superfamily ATPase
MSLFNSDHTNIITKPQWLQPLSDPPGGKPLCREAYLKLMANHLSDLFTAGQARNLFVYGEPGTGKTVCVTYVLKEVAKHAVEIGKPVQTAYVNAGKTRNPYYTMEEIVRQLGIKVPAAGWQTFRLKRVFEDLLATKSVLIAVDEVDSVLFKEKEPLVYYLSRQPRTTLILISNDVGDAVKLPKRALSTLQPILIPMAPYTKEETLEILKERIDQACTPGTFDPDALTFTAEATALMKDVRFGFRVLLTAASMAQKAGKQTVDKLTVADAVKEEIKLRKLKQLEAQKDRLHKMTRTHGVNLNF